MVKLEASASVFAALDSFWYRNGRARVAAEWQAGIKRQDSKDFFWSVLLDGALLDGGVAQLGRAMGHPKYGVMSNFAAITCLGQDAYEDELESFLRPMAEGGMGHRWGARRPAGRIFRLLAGAPLKIIAAYGSVDAAGAGLLKAQTYTAAKTWLDAVLPPSWEKNRSNFLMNLSLKVSVDDLAVDVRLKNIAAAWSALMSRSLDTKDHAQVKDYFRNQILPYYLASADGPKNLWSLDRAMFAAYADDPAFATALGLRRRLTNRGDGVPSSRLPCAGAICS